ncbi:uncharacterized protein LOC125945708 [Dermacentor silvarum]|uniref:uncharacterized protein LOC125945708 n=1 Tax=Dermacentor silvarum TaxID=543639 RepID=UPI002101D353|nr:uncharacterized protein LOC125945708 [Dermacentor silvarum]
MEVPPIVQRPPLICTYNIQKFSKQSALPSDGICDQIYLDSLCRAPPCSVPWTPTGVTTEFLDVAKMARTGGNKTRLGLAFDAHASNGLSIFSNGDDKKRITEELWNTYKCSHYASLDHNIRSFTSPAAASRLWNELLFLRTHVKSLSGVQDDFGLVLGILSTDIPKMIAKVLDDYDRKPPYLTNFVIISHTSFENYALAPYGDTASFDLTNCYIVPPTIHNYSSHYNQTYYTTLADSRKFLKKLLNATQTVPTAVSVTLKGRWFTSKAPVDQNRDLFKKCTKFNETTEAAPHSMCAFKERVKDLKFSFAVYDIDADESSNPCPKVQYTGQYNRLKLLRKLADFMENYTNKQDCESVS